MEATLMMKRGLMRSFFKNNKTLSREQVDWIRIKVSAFLLGGAQSEKWKKCGDYGIRRLSISLRSVRPVWIAFKLNNTRRIMSINCTRCRNFLRQFRGCNRIMLSGNGIAFLESRCNKQPINMYFILQMRMNNMTDGGDEPRGERFVTHVDLTTEEVSWTLSRPSCPKDEWKCCESL